MPSLLMDRLTNNAPLTTRDIESINCLLAQLSERATTLTAEDISQVIESGALIQIVRDRDRGERIVGMATLIKRHQLMGRYGVIEDVIVDSAYRGQGIGVSLMASLIHHAQGMALKRLDLTSNAARHDAQRLYEHLGFRRKETDVFTLVLNNSPSAST